MKDAILGTIQLMEAPSECISVEDSYNFSALSFSAKELSKAIQLHYPKFNIHYLPDHREQIAASWPESIDDTTARNDWCWLPKHDLSQLVEAMIKETIKQLQY